MEISRPPLVTKSNFRKELLASFGVSLALVTGIMGALAFMAVRSLALLDAADSVLLVSSETMLVEAEEEKEPEKFEVFNSLPVPVQVTRSISSSQEIPDQVEPPKPPEVTISDVLVWEEADFGGWEVPKKVEPKPKKVIPQKAPAKKAVSEKQRVAKKTPARPSPPRRAILAKVVTRKMPFYPRKARRSGVEGQVVVTVSVNTSGKVASARVTRSSQNASLDSAALSAARKFRFSPAKNTLGQTMISYCSLPFTFRLTGS